MGAEILRNAMTITPIFNTATIEATTLGLAVGDHETTLKLPAGKLLIGAFIRNLENNLAGETGATVGLKVGSSSVISATSIADVKGTGLGVLDTSMAPVSATADSVVKIAVGTADLTGGTIEYGISYV